MKAWPKEVGVPGLKAHPDDDPRFKVSKNPSYTRIKLNMPKYDGSSIDWMADQMFQVTGADPEDADVDFDPDDSPHAPSALPIEGWVTPTGIVSERPADWSIFLGHAKGTPDSTVMDDLRATLDGLKELFPGEDVGVRTGKSDYLEFKEAAGRSWADWQSDVVDSGRYNMIVVPAGPVGRATAGLLDMGAAAGILVVCLSEGKLCEVSRIVDGPLRKGKKGWERDWMHYATVLPEVRP